MTYDRSLLEPKIAIDEAHSYQSFFTLCKITPHPKLKQVGCWEPPTAGTLKLNVDGAFLQIFKRLESGPY